MKKTWIIVGTILLFVVAAASAATGATIVEVAGKVEFQAPGKAWAVAKAGIVLPGGTIVSTGFKSTVLLKVGLATITVKPITRLTLEEILESESGTQTQLFLLAGRVKADVKPQPGQTTQFRVKSPTATASVRGTGFEFDGVNLLVDHGIVTLRSSTGVERSVSQGEYSYVTDGGFVPTPVAVASGSGFSALRDLVAQSGYSSFLDALLLEPYLELDATIVVSLE
ncbi:MAG: FecR domain-containing protein [Spirochaetales bacterium]|nr:FecR domain-containing protein [Spirochaetales bacterium]